MLYEGYRLPPRQHRRSGRLRSQIEAYANLYDYELVEVLAEAASDNSLQRAALQPALAAKRARGEGMSGQPPTGYRHEDGRVVVDPAEMRMVDALRHYRSWGLRRIADRLYEDGYRTRRGGRVHFTQVGRVLARTPEGGAHV